MKKRILSLALALAVVMSTAATVPAWAALDNRVERAISWAISIANDNSHGYSQLRRNGPDYDCSSFVSTAFHQGGFNVSGSHVTQTMEKAFTSVGFKAYTAGSVTLQRGDILLNPDTHVELYLGNNQCVAAHWDYDGKPGDSSGREIQVRSRGNCAFCSSKNYTRILRYEGGTPSPSTLSISMSGYPSGALTRGNDASLNGTVSSNYTINFVQGSVIDTAGKTYLRKSYDPNSTSFSLYNSPIDNELTFNTLGDGSYYVKLIARDTSGAEKTWRSDTFTVQEAQRDPIASSITFFPSYVAMNPGESTTVSVNFNGDGIKRVYFGEGDRSICTASWNGSTDWSKGTSSLTLTAQSPGTTTVTFGFIDAAGNEYFHRDISITVNGYDTILSVSPSSVNLDLATKPSDTVTITLGGSFPKSAQLHAEHEGIAKGAWISDAVVNNQAEMKIYAEETGTGKWIYLVKSRDGYTTYATATVSVTATAPTYTVSYDPNGGSNEPSNQTKDYNKGLSLSSQKPTRIGYRFNGWATSPSADAAEYQPGANYDKNASLTLYAVWAPASGVKYTVKHYLADDGEKRLDATDILTGTTGETVSPTPREYVGYSTPSVELAVVQADGSTVIEYVYPAITHTVRIKADSGITSTYGDGTYRHGETVTISADVAEGYLWRQWDSSTDQIPSSIEQEYTFTMPDEDVVLWATCDEIPLPDCNNGHTWGDWTITQEPTCEQDGKRERFCAVCNEKEQERLTALTHNYKIALKTDSYIRYVCSNCGNEYTEPIDEYVEASENPIEPGSIGDIENFVHRNQYYSGTFRDVKSSDWFSENVKHAYELGLMNGTGGSVFSPGNNVTIAEAITLAARLHSIYYTGLENFSRYDGGNWYDPYVNYAREHGISSENYNYTHPATREEFVHILAAALPVEALENTAGYLFFADSADITYAADVRLLSGAGVINGIQESGQVYFKPWAPITRAEVATIITRMADPALR